MSIRVLDPDGRVLRPVSPAKANSWVEHGRARWVHAEGIESNRRRGAIILTHPVEHPPEDRLMVQIYDGDGFFLGWGWPKAATRVLKHKQCLLVGSKTVDGWPRAIIVPRTARNDSVVARELRHIEARGSVNAAIHRDALRDALNKGMAGGQLEAYVASLKRTDGRCDEIDRVISGLRYSRRQLSILDIIVDPDTSEIPEQMVEIWDQSRVHGKARSLLPLD